jgi:hypothetical protein
MAKHYKIPAGCINWRKVNKDKLLAKNLAKEQVEKDLAMYRQSCSKIALFNSLMAYSMDLAMVYMISKDCESYIIWAKINKKFGMNCDIICLGSSENCPKDCTAIYIYCKNLELYCEALESFGRGLVKAHNGEIMLKNGTMIDNNSKN